MNQAILAVPHEVLRRQSAPIAEITPQIRAHIHDLMDTIQSAHDPEGVGLSFPQIGLNLRGFVTFLDKRLKVYLNPVILDASEETTLGGTPEHPTLEGCLSIPWLYGPVPRPKKIKIQAIDERGSDITKTLSSFPARLFLHEYDHLEGVLFTDYTLKHHLPLYLLDREQDKFVEIQDPTSVIKW